jgi:cytidine deaminase
LNAEAMGENGTQIPIAITAAVVASTIGAAVLCASGACYLGVNIEACGYGPCAEPVAIGAASTAGEREIIKIAAVKKCGDEYPVLSPCGNCRQLLFDYFPDATVILDLDGKLHDPDQSTRTT